MEYFLVFIKKQAAHLVPGYYIRFKNNNNKKLKRGKKCFSSRLALSFKTRMYLFWPCSVLVAYSVGHW